MRIHSMVHWNGDQACAFYANTTGEDPLIDSIIELACIPLTTKFEIRKEIVPFYVRFRVENKDFDTWADHNSTAIDPITAKEFFIDWIEKLDIHTTRGGIRKRILPVTYEFDRFRALILDWLGADFDKLIGNDIKDVRRIVSYINDRASWRGSDVPYPKTKLSGVSTRENLQDSRRTDALWRANLCRMLYIRLLNTHFGMFT